MRISFIVIITLLLGSFAQASTYRGLEALMNEYSYDLTVEWDQKDKEVQKRITLDFLTNLKTLHENGELSERDVLAFADKNLISQHHREGIEGQLAQLEGASIDELAEFIITESASMRKQGASWNGDQKTTVIAVMGCFILFTAAFFYLSGQSQCLEGGAVDNCPDLE